MLIVFTTTPNIAEANSLADKLVEAKLAACVQILPQMTSVYVWEGMLQREPEYLLLIKTLPEKWDELRDFITANHTYEIPELIAVRADTFSETYFAWMKGVVG